MPVRRTVSACYTGEVEVSRVITTRLPNGTAWPPIRDSQEFQYGLGLLYDHGDGVAQDYVQAYLWYSLAIADNSGNTNATRGRDGVSRKMTPEQLAEAQALVQNWKPNDAGESVEVSRAE